MRHILMFSPLSKQELPHMQPAQSSNKLSLCLSFFLFQLAQTQTKTLVYEERKSRSLGNVEIIMFLVVVVMVVRSEVERGGGGGMNEKIIYPF